MDNIPKINKKVKISEKNIGINIYNALLCDGSLDMKSQASKIWKRAIS